MEDLWGRREEIMKKRVYLKLIIKGVKGRGEQKKWGTDVVSFIYMPWF